jgi:predicted RNA-binding protein associated with RNAse of E/G family
VSNAKREPGTSIEVTFKAMAIPFLVMPVTVVEDSDKRIAHFLADGTKYLRRVSLDDSPGRRVFAPQELTGEGTRMAVEEWRGSNRLIVTRPRQPHAVFLKFRPSTWEFTGWYVNLQEPLERTERGFATRDQFLDIVVAPDLSWRWKDEDELAEAVTLGRLTEAAAAGIRQEGERVLADIESRRWPFDGSLNDWRPDPAWAIPALVEDAGDIFNFRKHT